MRKGAGAHLRPHHSGGPAPRRDRVLRRSSAQLICMCALLRATDPPPPNEQGPATEDSSN